MVFDPKNYNFQKIDFRVETLNSGVGASGTHENFENLGTAGYRVPGKFEKLGTDGYRVPRKFSLMPTPA